jgi:hypothetical protein
LPYSRFRVAGNCDVGVAGLSGLWGLYIADPHGPAMTLSAHSVPQITKNALANCTEAGSFIAGVLIGVSIAAPAIVMTVSDHNGWQTLDFFGALVIMVLGLTSQVVVTARPRRLQATEPPVGALGVGFKEPCHEH